MVSQPKKKLNLTVDGEILERAKLLAESGGQSLSSMVEEFLSRVSQGKNRKNTDWLSQFHNEHLKAPYREVSDEKLKKIRAKRLAEYE